ncbi:uncharacterized protein LOC142324868 isoform X3 [Lycorma delicatula]|uniref:uncharacterized protein LOC142324868 isoform X3 n=1 Tax=Lycorma delicatula TaxID=130591 RepID=UPI003F51A85F
MEYPGIMEEGVTEAAVNTATSKVVMDNSWPVKIDINQYCRACANPSDCLVEIFETEGIRHELALKVNKYLPIKVSEEDKLPKSLCYNCASTLISWNNLVINCIQAEKKLTALVKSDSNGVSEDEFCENQSMDFADHDIEDVCGNTNSNETQKQNFPIEYKTTQAPDSTALLKSTVSESNVKCEDELPRVSNIDICETPVALTVITSCSNLLQSESSEPSTSTVNNEVTPTTETPEVATRAHQSFRNFQEAQELCRTNCKYIKKLKFTDFVFVSCGVNNTQLSSSKEMNNQIKEINKNVSSCDNGKSEITSHKTDNSFIEERNLKNNISVKKVNNKPEYICGKVFDVAPHFNKHMFDHKSDDKMKQTTVNINKCKSINNGDINDLEDNCEVPRLFASELPYNCNTCGKGFKKKDGFRAHLQAHSGEKPFTCHICGKQFTRHAGLNYHLKHVHLKIKNYSCDICGRSFAMKSFMEDHRRIHTGERPYICDICGKTFKTKASLYIHSKTHTDEYPFPCDQCNRKFRWRTQLESHFTIHSGEKNHTCDICGKQFGVKNHLTRHKLIHNNIKPYSCPLCSLTFGQKRYLKNHMKARHKCKYSDYFTTT